MVSQICQIGAEKLFFSVFSTRDSLTNKTKQKKKKKKKPLTVLTIPYLTGLKL